MSNIYTDKYPAGELWGGMFVVKPDKELFRKFFIRYKFFHTDEDLLNKYYQKQDIMVYKYDLFVLHEPFKEKYWKHYNLTSEEKIFNFLDNSLYKIMEDIPTYQDSLPHIRGTYESPSFVIGNELKPAEKKYLEKTQDIFAFIDKYIKSE